MKHSPDSVKWSSFDRWEGPVIWGAYPYAMPSAPSWAEKVMWIVSATEGNLDSVNMYDRAICSVGVIQWTELTGLNVSNILGLVAQRAPKAFAELGDAMERSAVKLERSPAGLWRFRRGEEWLDSAEKVRGMYLAGSGLKGFWSREQKAHASAWCAGLANVFTHEEAQQAQVEFTANRLQGFGLAPAVRVLWDGTCPSNTGIQGAARAAFLSYAINLPAVASKAVLKLETRQEKWSLPWLRDFLKTLVFGSGVAIWPARYDRIRPRLEAMFAVDLPDFAEELARRETDGLGSPAAIQAALLSLGFDPGPVDGVWGKRSEAAVREYQRSRQLEVDGQVGPITRARLRVDLDARPI